MIKLLFPILDSIKEVLNNNTELDIIAQNNYELAKELEEKNMPPMTAQEIKKYVNER